MEPPFKPGTAASDSAPLRFCNAFAPVFLALALALCTVPFPRVAHAMQAGEASGTEATSAADSAATFTPASTAASASTAVPASTAASASSVEQPPPDDPEADQTSGRQRAALAMGNAYDAWNLSRADGQVTIAVLDSGCDLAHPDLADNVIAEAAYNAIDGSADVSDSDGHGTHVAGIAAARADNGLGVAGVSYNARVLPVKVVADTGSADSYAIARGLAYVAKCARNHPEYNIRVVNLSVGGKGSASNEGDATAIRAMEELNDLGILVVTAAGNTDTSRKEVPPYRAWPGDFSDNVLSVMNAADADKRASGSNYNTAGQMTKRICAPGTNLYSTVPGGAHDGGTTDYGYKSGTSMASPYAAGVAALVFASNPKLDPAEATAVICGTAADMGAEGFDEETGFGMVDAAAAVRAASSGAYLKGTRSLLVGTTAALSPSSGNAEGYAWASSDENVARVDGCGNVTGIGSGYALVTARRDGIMLSQVVSVRAATMAGTNRMKAGDSAAWGVSSSLPDVWIWSSSDPGIASVSATGRVRARAAGSATITAALSSNTQARLSRIVTIEPSTVDISSATVMPLPAQTYTGSPIMPRPTVVMGDAVLELGRDYSLLYANNLSAGTSTVSITGMGSYTGSLTVTFTIVEPKKDPGGKAKTSIASAKVSGLSSATYTGKAIKRTLKVTLGGRALTAGRDYQVTYASNVKAGKARVTIAGTGSYAGKLVRSFTIKRAPMAKCTYAKVKTQKFRKGAASKPALKVSYRGKSLRRGTDYTLAYKNNRKRGTASIVVKGRGNFQGTKTVRFKIR